MVRGRPVRASTIASTKASLALSSLFSRLKSREKNPMKNVNSIATVAKTKSTMKRGRRSKKQSKQDDKSIVQYFTTQSKTSSSSIHSSVNDNAYDAFNVNDRDDCVTAEVGNTGKTENIFLQKPVLHLNFDKSPNQPSSIVINKHLDVFTNFSNSFAPFANSIKANDLNAAFRLHDTDTTTDESDGVDGHHSTSMIHEALPHGGERNRKMKNGMKSRGKHLERIALNRSSHSSDNGLIDVLNNSDSNSCDSGVVADKTLELSGTDDMKPTTPHRIVCTTSTLPYGKSDKMTKTTKRSSDIGNARKPKRRINESQSGDFLKFIVKSEKTEESPAESTETAETSSASDNEPSDHQINEPAKHAIAVSEINQIEALQIKNAVVKKSTQMTDFFPIRRSVRKTKRAVEQETRRQIELALEKQYEDGLVVKVFKDKGRGICANRPFRRGEFVVEYIGELIEQNEADRREEIYAKDSKLGCYMYYFKHKEQQWCIDATAESGKLGRLVNHSRNGNLMTKIVTYKNQPHLVLIAKEDIKEGEEVTYDYGDRTRESLINHPWLAY